MRRAVLALGGTIAGLILLLSFRTHTASTAAAGVTASGTGSATSGSSGGSTSGSATPTPTAAGSKTAAAGTGTAAGGTGTATGGKTVTGNVINGPYGPSQVAITLTGSKITKVTILQHTDDGVTSEGIDGPALPKLTAETLTAQSAKIDAVSGATYTSAGYIQSLQSAIDKAMA